MNITMSYEQWIEQNQKSTDSITSYRELNGFQSEDQTELFLYPHPLIEVLSRLSRYEATITNAVYYVSHDSEDDFHYEKVYIDVRMDGLDNRFTLLLDHSAHRLTCHWSPNDSGLENIIAPFEERFTTDFSQHILDFMKEVSPYRLYLVTHTYNTYQPFQYKGYLEKLTW